jgi:hypothetical protein
MSGRESSPPKAIQHAIVTNLPELISMDSWMLMEDPSSLS